MTIVPTYNPEENPSSKNPDSHLSLKIDVNLNGSCSYDLAILATGSNDITAMDTAASSLESLYSVVSEQSRTLFNTAEPLTKQKNMDVFLVEKTPKYDLHNDPDGINQKLTNFSSSVLASLTGATPRIFLVEQSNLNRSSVKARAEVFQADFLHLTNNKGLGFYNTNIINAINECYPDTKDLKNNNNYSEDISKTKDQPLNDGGFSGRDTN